MSSEREEDGSACGGAACGRESRSPAESLGRLQRRGKPAKRTPIGRNAMKAKATLPFYPTGLPRSYERAYGSMANWTPTSEPMRREEPVTSRCMERGRGVSVFALLRCGHAGCAVRGAVSLALSGHSVACGAVFQ